MVQNLNEPVNLHATKQRLLRRIEELTSIILAFYCPVTWVSYKSRVKMYFDYLEHIEKTRGLEATVKFVKTSRNAVTRFICGQPLDMADGVELKDGWPVWLTALKPLCETLEGKRFLITLLIVLRGVKLKPKLDLTPIEEAWKGKDTVTGAELDRAFRILGIPILLDKKGKVKPAPQPVWSRFHISTKSSPFGQALLTAVQSLAFFPHHLLEDIYLVGGLKLREQICGLFSLLPLGKNIIEIWTTFYKVKGSGSLRKISYFSDKEGKTRVIALLDYWSQSALRPLHKYLMELLKGLPRDCTFNQNGFTERPLPGPYFSFDLSNATDRIPLSLQKRIIEKLFGTVYAEAWARILVGQPYAVQKSATRVSYNCGQPMGAYSSWATIALTHHLIVCVAALRAGHWLGPFEKYHLLGDDLVIADSIVAAEYEKLCSELDIPISPVKTHVSDDTFEFAKRWFYQNEEFTGFSVSGLLSVWKKYSLLQNFLQTQQAHGWKLDSTQAPNLIRNIYTLIGRSIQSERVIKLYMVFDALTKVKVSQEYNLIGLTVKEYFPGTISELLISSLERDSIIANKQWKDLLATAKRRLVERDLDKFQVDAYKVNDRLNKEFTLAYPSLDGQSYRRLLRTVHPMIVVLNYLIDDSIALLTIAFIPEDEKDLNTYLDLGLSKYFVSQGVFSIRSSHSITLAQSMVVKALLSVCLEDKRSSIGSSTKPEPPA